MSLSNGKFYKDGLLDEFGSSEKPRLFANGVEQVFASITFGTSGEKTVTFRGTNGANLYIDPGDGSAVDTVTLLGTGTDADWVHTYSSAGAVVRIAGAVSSVSLVRAVNYGVSSLDFQAFSQLTEIKFNNNPLTQISVPSALGILKTYYTSLDDISFIDDAQSLGILWHYSCGVTDVTALQSASTLYDLKLQGNNIQTLPASFPAWTTGTFRFDDNPNLPTTEWLLKLDAAGVANSTLRADGTCPAHDGSAEVLTAIANLITRGCTVTVNAP